MTIVLKNGRVKELHLYFFAKSRKKLTKNTQSATGCCVMSMLCFINGWMGTDDQLLWGFVWNDGIHAALINTQGFVREDAAIFRIKWICCWVDSSWNLLFSLIMMGSDWFNLLPGFLLLAWIEKMILIACVFNPFHMVGHQTNWSDHHFKSGMYSERQWQRNRMVDLFAENLQSHFWICWFSVGLR